jgi:hypothetical protein
MITGVELASESLLVSGLLPEWRMELPLRALEDLLTQLTQGALSFSWPSLFGGSG